jgi:hypothetical protein
MPKNLTKKREIKLEKLLYEEYLREMYVVYNYKNNTVATRRKTDHTYRKWRTQKFISNTKKG